MVEDGEGSVEKWRYFRANDAKTTQKRLRAEVATLKRKGKTRRVRGTIGYAGCKADQLESEEYVHDFRRFI